MAKEERVTEGGHVRTGATLDIVALSRFCGERLAAYKCPTEIKLLPDLPKTATGKIIRNALKLACGPAIEP